MVATVILAKLQLIRRTVAILFFIIQDTGRRRLTGATNWVLPSHLLASKLALVYSILYWTQVRFHCVLLITSACHFFFLRPARREKWQPWIRKTKSFPSKNVFLCICNAICVIWTQHLPKHKGRPVFASFTTDTCIRTFSVHEFSVCYLQHATSLSSWWWWWFLYLCSTLHIHRISFCQWSFLALM